MVERRRGTLSGNGGRVAGDRSDTTWYPVDPVHQVQGVQGAVPRRLGLDLLHPMTGWRAFECDGCQHAWEWPTQDTSSPSAEFCPKCGDRVSPSGSREEVLPVDNLGNLLIPWNTTPKNWALTPDTTLSKAEFQAAMARLNQWAQHGCSDGGCLIEKPRGMHTNGGCRCTPRTFSEHLLELAARLDEMGRHARWKK